MATHADWQMLQNSLGNLGQSFVINRELADRKDEKEKDRGEREKDRKADRHVHVGAPAPQ